jgi:esterase
MQLHLNFREAGEGPPLIILHGVFGSGENWLTVSKLFTPFFKVFLVDQRNHGRSPQTEDFSYQLMVEDLKDFADQQNLDSFFLIGHSMGGKVAMKFASLHPERLERMVVVDIAPRYYNPHHHEIIAGFKAVDLEKMTTRQQADDAMARFIQEVDVRQFLLKNLYRNDQGKFAFRINLPVLEKSIDAIGEPLDPRSRITVPTLFIKGENSRYISQKDENDIGTIFPNSSIRIISNAGHWVQAEQPQLFADAVLSFFNFTQAQ